MNVGHAVVHHPPNLLQALIWTHCTDCVALHQYVATRQELQSLQSRAIRSEYSLPSFNEAVFVRDLNPDFDYVARHAIFQHLDRLWSWDAASEKLDEVAGIENGGRVVGLPSRLDRPINDLEISERCEGFRSER